jgi:molecular chaperone DnaK (HSP70)
MPVGAVGCDIDCHNSVIATVKQKSIEVVFNELTNRSTHNVVAFGPKQRFLGEVVYSKLSMNFRNSFVAPSRFLGLTAEYLRQIEGPKQLTDNIAYTAEDTPVFEATYTREVHS